MIIKINFRCDVNVYKCKKKIIRINMVLYIFEEVYGL